MKNETGVKRVISSTKQIKSANKKNKENNAYIMNMEEYRKRKLKEDIEEHLLKSEDDIRNGRVRDAREVFNEWKRKYGI